MAPRLKQNQKKRGHVSTGQGRVRKHLGRRGNAGGMHHHRILFDKYHPGYFGKVAMRHFHLLWNKHHCPIVNVDLLGSLVPDDDVKDGASKDGRAAPMRRSSTSLSLATSRYSAKVSCFRIAEKKIKVAGGAVVLTA